MELEAILGIRVPIIQGGMGNISSAQLTAAVSEAGGLGTIGAGTMNPEQVERLIKETKQRTDQPFALNIPISVNRWSEEMLRIAVQYKLKAVSLSAGNPAPYISYLRDNGVVAMCVVSTVKHALKAAAAGAQIVIAEGVEAAGIHSSFETTTLALIPQVVDAIKLPVVAAGGIADGRGMLAMFALGAKGIQMGTRFVVTTDAPFSPLYKKRLLEADDTSTIVIGRSLQKGRRVLAGPYTKSIKAQEERSITPVEFQQATNEDRHLLGALKGNEEEGYMNCGQIAGLINRVQTVRELIDSMMEECDIRLKEITAIRKSKEQG